MKKYLKRHITLLTLIAMALAAQAQYSDLYYHRTGDTIMYDSPIYYHNWWDFENSYHTQDRRYILFPMGTPYKLLSYGFTPTPLEVIGIAFLQPEMLRDLQTGELLDSLPLQEYFLIYEATLDSIHKVAEIPWHPNDLSRHIIIRGNGSTVGTPGSSFDSDSLCCNNGVRWSQTLPLVEYYFDSSVFVHDSFYIGQTYYSYLHPSVNRHLSGFPPFNYYNSRSAGGWVNCEGQSSTEHGYSNEICGMYWPSIVYNLPGTSIYNEHPNPWYTNYWIVPMVFPIIRVDTTVPPPDYCPPVENLQVLTAGDSCVDVSWDAFINHQYGYEVQYGPRSMPMGNWQSVFPNFNFAHICELDPTFLYGLRVRPYCDEDKQEGEWSEVVYFRPTVGAALEPSELSKHTTVAPNPATESVRVESDYVIMKVDLYDAVGQHVWNIPVHGRLMDIDLNGLAAGVYHLLITTSDGTTAKRLVVTR